MYLNAVKDFAEFIDPEHSRNSFRYLVPRNTGNPDMDKMHQQAEEMLLYGIGAVALTEKETLFETAHDVRLHKLLETDPNGQEIMITYQAARPAGHLPSFSPVDLV